MNLMLRRIRSSGQRWWEVVALQPPHKTNFRFWLNEDAELAPLTGS